MYIFGYLQPPPTHTHRANNRKKAFVCNYICRRCWRRAVSKRNSCTAEQREGRTWSCLGSTGPTAFGWGSGRGGRTERKVFTVYHRALLSGPLSPQTFHDPFRCLLLWCFATCHTRDTDLWEGTLQKKRRYKHMTSWTVDLQNLSIWISKIAIYLFFFLFVGPFLIFVIEQKSLFFPVVVLSPPPLHNEQVQQAGWLEHPGHLVLTRNHLFYFKP